MAGHSHWAGIKHHKATMDTKRGKLFSKLSKAIIVAARLGGGDPDSNLRLRYAIDKARSVSMPKDNIERAIKAGTGELEGVSYEEVLYEGYGAGGIAVLADCLTDNRARTAGEMRKLFEVQHGKLAVAGAVAWMFQRRGLCTIDANTISEELLMEVAIEAGADDVRRSDTLFEVICEPASLQAVKAALADRNIATKTAELSHIPTQTICPSPEDARKIIGLMDALEDHPDVQDTYANFDIPAEVLATLEAEAE